jgi:hypothetical protein
VAGVYTSAKVKLYVNGKLVAEKALPKMVNPGIKSLVIGDGAQWKGKNLLGSLSDVRIYSMEKLETEIAQDMNNSTTVDESFLIANWKMNEGSGNVVACTRGLAHLLKPFNVQWFLEPQYPKTGLVFSGATESRIECGFSTLEYMFAKPNGITLEAWVNLSDLTDGNILSNEDNASGAGGYALRLYGKRFDCTVGCQDGTWSQCVAQSVVPMTNAWYHLAAVIFPEYIEIFVNGESVAIKNMEALPNMSTKELTIGASPIRTDRSLKGKLSNIRFWKVNLSPTEIKKRMYSDLSGKEEGLVANWKLNEGLDNDLGDATGIFNLKKTDSIKWFNGVVNSNRVQISVSPGATIEVGEKTQLSVNATYTGAGKLKYRWFPSIGLDNDTIPNPMASPLKTTDYTVWISASDGLMVSDKVNVTVSPFEVKIQSETFNSCGSSFQLDASTNYVGSGRLRYSWFPSKGLDCDTIPNPICHLLEVTTYKVVVTLPDGSNSTRNITLTPTSIAAEIRMVSVNAENMNVITWNAGYPAQIDSVHIYKEGSVTDVYEYIGSAPVANQNFVDESSGANVCSNKYKICFVDPCGYEMSFGNPHKTIHLSVSKNGAWNLIWEPYFGFIVPTYHIYRGTTRDNMTLMKSVAGSVTQYSDFDAPEGNVFYQIVVALPAPQNLGRATQDLRIALTESEQIVSRSNIVNCMENSMDLSNTVQGDLILYPNPTTNQIQFSGTNLKTSRIRILDISGTLVKEVQGIASQERVDVSMLPNAVYFVEVNAGDRVYRKKLVIRR